MREEQLVRTCTFIKENHQTNAEISLNVQIAHTKPEVVVSTENE